MNYIDLFSGIGGFALGAYWAGLRFDNHFFSDIEKYAIALYQKRFSDAIPLGDITKIDTVELKEKYGNAWVLTGGFPCQDISIAGKGVGIEGKRSGLWFEYWRLIRDLRPRIAVMENVGAITFRGLDAVLGSLAEIGYNAEWQDIRAEDMGAPHKRERIWIIAYPGSIVPTGLGQGLWGHLGRESEGVSGDTNEKIPDPSVKRGECGQARKSWEHTQCEEGILGRSDTGEVSYTDGKRLEGRKESREFEEKWENSEQFHKRYGKFTGTNHWSIEPDVGRLAHGIPRRMDRLKGLGNAIVPQIAMILWTLVKSILEEEL